jgi:hypothetical protein
MLKIAIIIGSTRPMRKGEAVGKWVFEQAQRRSDAEYELIDLKEVNLPLLDEPKSAASGEYAQPHTRAWSARIAAFDAELDQMNRHFLAASTAVIMQPCYPAKLVYPTTPAQFPRQKSRQTDASVIRSDESTHRFPAIAQQAVLAAASATKLKAHARGEEE